MKNHSLVLLLATVFVLLNVASASAFDNSQFKGRYAFGISGPSSVALANEPLTVATGLMIADGKGSITGHGTFRSAGNTCIGQITGGYTVQPDGSGILSASFATTSSGCFSISLIYDLALANDGEIIEIANSENDYMSGKLTRQGKAVFSKSDLSGSYALRLQGPSSVVKANEPLTVGVGVLTSDGNGALTGTGTLRSAGVTCFGTFTGNYTIANDGTGAILTVFSTSTPGCFSMVVDLSFALFKTGNGAELANTENDMMSGTLHRQIFK